jgi:hypothetical protein
LVVTFGGYCLAICISKTQLGLLTVGCAIALAVILTGTAVTTTTSTTAASLAAFTWFATFAIFLGLAVGIYWRVALGFCARFAVAFCVLVALSTPTLAWATVTTLIAVTTGCALGALLVVGGVDLHRILTFDVLRLAITFKTFALGTALTTSAATTACATTTFAASVTTFTATFGTVAITAFGRACLAATFATGASAIATSTTSATVAITAFAFVIGLGHWGCDGLGHHGSFIGKQIFEPAKETLALGSLGYGRSGHWCSSNRLHGDRLRH